MPLDQPTFPGERLLVLTGAGRILTSAFATNPEAALDDDPETFASWGEVTEMPTAGDAIDLVYLIDCSGSMEDSFGSGDDSGTRMEAAIAAILAANDALADLDTGEAPIRAAAVSFGAGGIAYGNEDARVESPLTDDLAEVSATVELLFAAGTTPTKEGLLSVRALLEARADSTRTAVVVLLSDGEPDDVNGAKSAAAALKSAHPTWKLVAAAIEFEGDISFMEYVGETVGDGFIEAETPEALATALSAAILSFT